MLFRGYVALRFPTADINSPAAAGVNCQEEGIAAGGACQQGKSQLAVLFGGYVALRFPTRDTNSPAAAGVNCQEEGI